MNKLQQKKLRQKKIKKYALNQENQNMQKKLEESLIQKYCRDKYIIEYLPTNTKICIPLKNIKNMDQLQNEVNKAINKSNILNHFQDSNNGGVGIWGFLAAISVTILAGRLIYKAVTYKNKLNKDYIYNPNLVSNSVSCPGGFIKYGDGSACKKGSYKCSLRNNYTLERCFCNQYKGNILTTIGDGSACKSIFGGRCALWGNSSLDRCSQYMYDNNIKYGPWRVTGTGLSTGIEFDDKREQYFHDK